MSSGYKEEFELLFERSRADLDDYLRGLALDLKLSPASQFRSICWRIFLDCLPEDRADWPQTLQRKRLEYSEKISEFDFNPREEIGDNPLSQDDQSKWNKYFQDEELRQMIQQDVHRTWPEIEVFQSDRIHNMMTAILFYYSKAKPALSYRQGMHEILAPIIYVIHCDQTAFKHAKDNGDLSGLTDSNLRMFNDLLDPKYMAHDSYAMFSSLMETLESWYSCTENGQGAHESPQPFSKSSLEVHTVLGLKLHRINQSILKRLDPTLQSHLETLEINAQVFGIRWLRLLFGREFPLHSVLCLWDTIFADSISLDLADYIFAAMLVAIRDRLLSSDNSQCLSLLMRYPEDVDVFYVVKLALHFRDHYKYPRPLRQLLNERPKSPKRNNNKPNRPQTLDFLSPESDETDWQNMVSSGNAGVARELGMTTTGRQLAQMKTRVAECALAMDAHLSTLQLALRSSGIAEEALVALAQLKSIRDQLKEMSGAEDIEEEDWTFVGTPQENNGSLDVLKRKLNGLINRD